MCIRRLTGSGAAQQQTQVRLVAVSKLKPVNDILALHQAPTAHVDFGENYAQELKEKADLLPRAIRWHFIGGLQSGKSHAFALGWVPCLLKVCSADPRATHRALQEPGAHPPTCGACPASTASRRRSYSTGRAAS